MNSQTLPLDINEQDLDITEKQEPEMLSREIGRIPVISYSTFSREQFHLRTLLHVVKGPKSFKDLRTVNGVECKTYQEAAVKLGLFEDDSVIEQTLEEAFSIKFGRVFRHCFVMVMINTTPSKPEQIWEKFKSKLCEDFKPKGFTEQEPTEIMINKALHEMSAMFQQQGHDMVKFGLPAPTGDMDTIIGNQVIEQELDYDKDFEHEFSESNYCRYNEGQKAVHDKIVTATVDKTGELIFVAAPGGTGKSYVLNTVMAELRSEGLIVLAMATSGIGSTLLKGGGTVHGKCKVSIDLTETSMCSYPDNSPMIQLIKEVSLMIIDEATLGDRLLYECLDRTFKHYRENDLPCGGITMVFSGDWRQCLPVVPGGGPADIMHHTLKMSKLWSKVIIIE